MRVLAASLVVFVSILTGCGGDPKPATADGPAVIKAWADAVRAGDYDKAADLFALPATVSNGEPKFDLDNREQVDAFNRSFPCGAVLEGTSKQADNHLLALFRLVRADDERTCAGSVGAKAQVSFLVTGGKIREWFRVSTEPPPGSQSS